MGLFDGCLLASDVDDTLVANGVINPKNREKIDYFISQGGIFSLSTGRGPGAMKPILRGLNRISPSVLTNGALIYDLENASVLYSKTLTVRDKVIAKAIKENFPKVGMEINSGALIMLYNRTRESDIHEEYEEMDVLPVTFRQAAEQDWNKVLFMFDDADDIPKVKEFIKGFETDSVFVDTSAVIGGIKRPYLEQIPRGISKASALLELCKMLNIKKGCLYAIGDYYNDLDMIKNADIGAATAGAPDDIKQYADYITCSAENGAVADFIDYLTQRKETEYGRSN